MTVITLTKQLLWSEISEAPGTESGVLISLLSI